MTFYYFSLDITPLDFIQYLLDSLSFITHLMVRSNRITLKLSSFLYPKPRNTSLKRNFIIVFPLYFTPLNQLSFGDEGLYFLYSKPSSRSISLHELCATNLSRVDFKSSNSLFSRISAPYFSSNNSQSIPVPR